jgi:hypothetical protein
MATLATTDSSSVSGLLRGYSDVVQTREQFVVKLVNLGINVSDRVSTFDVLPTASSLQSYGGFGAAWFGGAWFADAPNVTTQPREQITVAVSISVMASELPVLFDASQTIIPLPDTFYVAVSELAFTSEQRTALVPFLLLNRNETATVAEQVAFLTLLRVAAADTALVASSPVFDMLLALMAEDSLQTTEAITGFLPFFSVAVTDAGSVADSISATETSKKKSRLTLLGVG